MAQYIPDEHFKGIQNKNKTNPLAFITPTGTDKAAEKRMETVRDWSNGWNNQLSDKAQFETIKNVALTGFKISEEIRRWSTSNVVWRIDDPRGFQLEISSGNMAYLLAESVINHGVIESELQWVRNGAQNFLLPTDSDEYKKYSRITETLKSHHSLKDINIGDTIQLGTGQIGMYLGGYHVISHGNWDKHVIDSKRKLFLLAPETEQLDEELIERSSFKNIALIKRGTEADNKDWSEKIKELSTSNWSLYVSVKKQNIKEIYNSLRWEETKSRDNNSALYYDFVMHNDDVYNISTYCGGNGSATKVKLYPTTNSMANQNNRNNMIVNSFFSNHGVEEKIYRAIIQDCVPVRLTATIQGKSFNL